MLYAIISPAKQMQIARETFAPRGIPPFPSKTQRIWRELLRIEREHGPEGLKRLWHVNDRLLVENLDRLHAFEPVLDESQLDEPVIASLVAPAAFSYVGIQYRSLAPEVLDLDALDWLQSHLWILSGFYGCVRPFDAVEPYRLEMGAKLSVGDARDLYDFWGDDIVRAIESQGEYAGAASTKPGAMTCIINLASVEYAKAVLPHADERTKITTCIFGEGLRGERPVQHATASKIARGSMVRWMAEHQTEIPEELKRFDVGYRFAPELSTDETFVFMRAN